MDLRLHCFSIFYCHFDYSVRFSFKQSVCFVYSFERESVGNEWCGVYFSFFYEPEDFRAVASVHSSCLECQVFPVHVGQGKRLCFFIKRHDGDCGIGTCAFPRHAERVVASRHFQDNVCSSVFAVTDYKVMAVFGGGEHHFRVMSAHEFPSFFRPFTYYDALGRFQHYA